MLQHKPRRGGILHTLNVAFFFGLLFASVYYVAVQHDTLTACYMALVALLIKPEE